jgi:hypothetical protein
LTGEQEALEFVQEAFKHCKTIAAFEEGTNFLTDGARRQKDKS